MNLAVDHSASEVPVLSAEGYTFCALQSKASYSFPYIFEIDIFAFFFF